MRRIRSADFQSTVSPNCIRQGVEPTGGAGTRKRCGLQIRATADCKSASPGQYGLGTKAERGGELFRKVRDGAEMVGERLPAIRVGIGRSVRSRCRVRVVVHAQPLGCVPCQECTEGNQRHCLHKAVSSAILSPAVGQKRSNPNLCETAFYIGEQCGRGSHFTLEKAVETTNAHESTRMGEAA